MSKRDHEGDANDETKRVKNMCSLAAPTFLNEKQQKLFDYIINQEEFEPIFVSGSAGTGKSALLLALKKHWTQHNKIVWVASYTNLAARNVEGNTIHSTFGFDLQLNLTTKKVGAPNYLILDEISLVPDKMLDLIDDRLRASTRNEDKPFGGVNTIIFGDMYQLPPVDDRKNDLQIRQPFYADVWKHVKLYELTQNMRQSELEFITALNMLRLGDPRCRTFFSKMVMNRLPNIEETIANTNLVAKRREADQINRTCYQHVFKKNPHVLEYEVSLDYNSKKRVGSLIVYKRKQLEQIFFKGLRYCVGTRVMVTHNIKGSFCNGDMGVIIEVKDGQVCIRRDWDDREMWLGSVELAFEHPRTWTKVELIAALPICYGWAVTIHKAQGMTVRNLIVHLDGIFADGQAYVALSRVVHCDGLKLVNPIPSHGIYRMEDVDNMYEKQPRLLLD